jgi:hypothetical protein
MCTFIPFLHLLSFFLESDPRLFFGQQRGKGIAISFCGEKDPFKDEFCAFFNALGIVLKFSTPAGCCSAAL